MSKIRKVIIPIMVVSVVCAGLLFVSNQKSSATESSSSYLTYVVSKGTVDQKVQANGMLRPSRLVAVGAQVSGRLTSMKVKVGDRVAKGDLIATIDDVTQKNDLKTAMSSLDDIKAQKKEKEAELEYYESSMNRESVMLSKNATSRDSYESAKKNYLTTVASIESLSAQIAQSEVKVDTAKINLGYTSITSPTDGTILLVVTQEGQNVNAVQSAPTIVVLGDIDEMLVRAEISEADVTKVSVGQDVNFSIMGDLRKKWSGKLAYLDPAPDSLRSDNLLTSSSSTSSSSSSSSSSAIYYYGGVLVKNPDGYLKTYMTAQVNISIAKVDDVMVIPKDALSDVDSNGYGTVLVLKQDGTTEKRKVVRGIDDKIMVEVKSGLQLGEKVVIGTKSSSDTTSMPHPPGGL